MKKLMGQIIRFGLVGFLCFFIDYGLLLALTELAGFHYLVSGALSFAVSVVVNYLLSLCIFRGEETQPAESSAG